MTYIIKCNNDWILFRNVPSNYARFDYDNKGPHLKCGKEIVRGELLTLSKMCSLHLETL
jgi:hypothetical protein